MKFSLLAAPLALFATSAWANDAADGSSGSRASDATVATQATEVADTTEFELATGIDYSVGSVIGPGAGGKQSKWGGEEAEFHDGLSLFWFGRC